MKEMIRKYENDLKKCFEHYCIAKPTDYTLRRTHLSWFNENGGKDEFSKILEIDQVSEELVFSQGLSLIIAIV